ncbi:hypothetical protein EON83_20675 [bacterium]|nr:MAG: hypothetical protein EON83_20675 [bacterium]
MFGFSNALRSDGHSPSDSYVPQVRAANALADLLKRTRPYLSDQISELQTIVTRCQRTLDENEVEQNQAEMSAEHDARISPGATAITEKALAAQGELDGATQALLDLRHEGPTEE